MRLREILRLVRVGRPHAPYGGARRLARTHSVEDVARAARRRLPRGVAGYLDGGGEDEVTLRRNRRSFEAHRIVPAPLHDVGDVDTSTTLLGRPCALPLALAPVGAPRLFHHRAELAAARAARALRIPFGVSTLATTPLQDIASETDGTLWLQLYLWGDRSVARDLLAQADACGLDALVITVDAAVRSKRERELRAGITLPRPSLTLRTVLDGVAHPVWSWHFLTSPAPGFPNIGQTVAAAGDGPGRLEAMFDGTLTWDDVAWIRETWHGPLALKGVLGADTARRAVEAGADGVIVSNHGGRQLDRTPATIDVLPEIVQAVGDRAEVLLDSGIRRGTDILTALALGAHGVLVGRAWLYGLAAGGEAGVHHSIDVLAEELRTAMALAGARTVGDLHPGMIQRPAHR
jgi:L-lactate dehydrogenase (cytochrome)